MKYYEIRELEPQGMPVMLDRTGWSGEVGCEIFLRDSQYGDEFWIVL
jgi:glycine cleavage system aminomethyltransferase T